MKHFMYAGSLKHATTTCEADLGWKRSNHDRTTFINEDGDEVKCIYSLESLIGANREFVLYLGYKYNLGDDYSEIIGTVSCVYVDSTMNVISYKLSKGIATNLDIQHLLDIHGLALKQHKSDELIVQDREFVYKFKQYALMSFIYTYKNERKSSYILLCDTVYDKIQGQYIKERTVGHEKANEILKFTY